MLGCNLVCLTSNRVLTTAGPSGPKQQTIPSYITDYSTSPFTESYKFRNVLYKLVQIKLDIIGIFE